MQEDDFVERYIVKDYTTVIKPTKYMRSPPLLFGHGLPNNIKNSPDSISSYLRKVFKRKSKIYQKVTGILHRQPSGSLNSSMRIPIKTSRLSPFVYRKNKHKALPSLTPVPQRPKKRDKEKLVVVESKEENEVENNIGVLSVSTKRLNKRFQKQARVRRMEVGINTNNINLEEFKFEESDVEDEDLEDIYLYKGYFN